MSKVKKYTGLTIEGPMSTPYRLNAFKEGVLIETVDLWENNPTGKAVRKAYQIQKTRLEKLLK